MKRYKAVNTSKQSKFFCPYCKDNHYHSKVDEGVVEHRVAHCHTKEGRQAHQQGYELTL